MGWFRFEGTLYFFLRIFKKKYFNFCGKYFCSHSTKVLAKQKGLIFVGMLTEFQIAAFDQLFFLSATLFLDGSALYYGRIEGGT